MFNPIDNFGSGVQIEQSVMFTYFLTLFQSDLFNKK